MWPCIFLIFVYIFDIYRRYKRATAYIIEKKYESALKDLAKVLVIKGDYAQAIDKRYVSLACI